jgi:hypothetical protein
MIKTSHNDSCIEPSLHKPPLNDKRISGPTHEPPAASPTSQVTPRLRVVVDHGAGRRQLFECSVIQRRRHEEAGDRCGEARTALFIRLLQLEVLPKVEQTLPTTRKRPHHHHRHIFRRRRTCRDRWLGMYLGRRPAPPEGRLGRIKEAIWDEIRGEVYGVVPPRPVEPWIADTPEYEDYQAWVALLRRLLPLVTYGGRIAWAVEMMAGRDMGVWGKVPERCRSGRPSSGRPSTSSGDRPSCSTPVGVSASTYSCFNGDEMKRTVRSLEMLAGDVESFGGLVLLCPCDRVGLLSAHLLLRSCKKLARCSFEKKS